MLFNVQKIDSNADFRNPEVVKFSEIYWLPVSESTPVQTSGRIYRNSFTPRQSQVASFFGFYMREEATDFISIDPGSFQIQPFMNRMS